MGLCRDTSGRNFGVQGMIFRFVMGVMALWLWPVNILSPQSGSTVRETGQTCTETRTPKNKGLHRTWILGQEAFKRVLLGSQRSPKGGPGGSKVEVMSPIQSPGIQLGGQRAPKGRPKGALGAACSCSGAELGGQRAPKWSLGGRLHLPSALTQGGLDSF